MGTLLFQFLDFKYVSQAILCWAYGLAQMKKLPDLLKFCLVCLAGPVLNDNTADQIAPPRAVLSGSAMFAHILAYMYVSIFS